MSKNEVVNEFINLFEGTSAELPDGIKQALCDVAEVEEDLVNSPKHYQSHPVFAKECIEYTEHMTFIQGNAFKYMFRLGRKVGSESNDLDKAKWYAERNKKPNRIPESILESMDKDIANYASRGTVDLEVFADSVTMYIIAAGYVQP